MKGTRLGFLALAAMAGAVGSGLAAPAADPAAGYYSNTVLSMNQPKYVIRAWFYADHTFRQFKASHETGNLLLAGWEGKWALQGNQICLTYDPQPVAGSLPPPTKGCTYPVGHKLGDVWKVTYNDGPYKGTTETFTVVEGHNTDP